MRRVINAALLGGRDWIYLLGLLVPLFCYDLVLKGILIFSHPDADTVSDVLELARSDILFNLGYVALWVGLFALFRRGIPRGVIVVLFHLSTALVAVITTSAYVYYRKTGSTLDYGVVAYALPKIGEVKGIIGSVATPPMWAGLAVVVLYAVFGPWLLTRLAVRRGLLAFAGRARASLLAPAGILLVALGLVGFSLPASGENTEGQAFARDAVVNLVMSKVDYDEMESSIPISSVSVPEPPLHTRLVPTPRTERKNVVFIHLESTRARSVTPYNPGVDTTPYLDKLSQKSIFVKNAYTIVPHTSKAIVAVNCGIYPHLTSKITEAAPGGVPANCLPRLLAGQGYNTVAFQSATGKFEDRGPLDKNFGYQQFFPLESLPDKSSFEKVNYFGREDDIMLGPSERWIEEHPDKPFMMYYLGVTGHDNYLPIHRYGFKHYTDDKMLNRYLNDVNYSDHFVHKVIEMYKRLGLYKNTIFVIYGDHGEGFGEHGLYQHDDTIYQEGLRIPLMILDPGDYPHGRVVTTPTDELDILPTVVDLLGYKVEGGGYQGRSMLAPPEPHRTLHFSCWDDYTCLASIKDDKKYIYFFGNKPDEVYDLSIDPYERHDIAGKQSQDWLEGRRSELLTWLSRVNAMYKENTPASYR